MSDPPENPRRALTQNELLVLEQIQDMYGPQNTEDRVFFSDRNEAVLMVTDRDGVAGMMTVLTNLGAWYADGTIGSLQELRDKWLSPG
jgi:hypothetical protein